MQEIVLTRGLPASGKSTWARNLVKSHQGKWKRVNKDDLRAMIDDGIWSKGNEKFILKMRDTLVLEFLKGGYNVIVDDTNLSVDHYKRMQELAKIVTTDTANKISVRYEQFTHIPLEECLKRDARRPNYVGEKVINRMYRQYLKPEPILPPKPVYSDQLSDCIMCDLDGTLAIMGNRSPYEDTKCLVDEPNTPIIHVVRTYQTLGFHIVFLSGRKERSRENTIQWMINNEIIKSPEDVELHMRPDDDDRKDSILKQELYETHVKGKYNPLFVLDDRNQVVEMWRSLGLTCMQVAPGNF